MSQDYSIKKARNNYVRLDLKESIAKKKPVHSKKKNSRFKIHYEQKEKDLKISKLPGRLFHRKRASSGEAMQSSKVWIQFPSKSNNKASYLVDRDQAADMLGIPKDQFYKHLLRISNRKNVVIDLKDDSNLLVDPRSISKSMKTAYTSAERMQPRLDRIRALVESTDIRNRKSYTRKEFMKEAKRLKSKKITKDIYNKTKIEDLLNDESFKTSESVSPYIRYLDADHAKDKFDDFMKSIWWVKQEKKTKH